LRIGVGRPIERRHQISRELRALFDGQIKCIVQQLCSGSACGHAHYDNRSAIDRNLAQRHGVGGCGEVLGGSPTACSGSCSIVLGGVTRAGFAWRLRAILRASPARALPPHDVGLGPPSRGRGWRWVRDGNPIGSLAQGVLADNLNEREGASLLRCMKTATEARRAMA